MKKFIYMIVALVGLTGCIDNDLPYPVVVPHISSITASGAESVDINYDERTVILTFPETTDLRDIEITSVEIDQEIAVPSIEIVGRHDPCIVPRAVPCVEAVAAIVTMDILEGK